MGILHLPERPLARAVAVITGGPQYRVGSHRQFTLLGRSLAAEGIAVLRFDYRGMGDSDGKARTFEQIDLDIRAAIDALFARVPLLKEVVLWGLCDAASAALFYAHIDPRVAGVVLLNPWIRTETGIARAYLKYYYASRLFDRDLWRKIRRGEFNPRAALQSFGEMLRIGLRRRSDDVDALPAAQLPQRMLQGLKNFRGRVLLILSGDDLTASEFNDVVAESRQWRKLLASRSVTRYEIASANHTFSRREWRDQVAARTLEWLRAW